MKKVLCLLLAMLMTLSLAAAVAEETAQEPAKVRTIITTDGEADDQCSLMRYLLYANEFELEAIVSTSSMFHYTEPTRKLLTPMRRFMTISAFMLTGIPRRSTSPSGTWKAM